MVTELFPCKPVLWQSYSFVDRSLRLSNSECVHRSSGIRHALTIGVSLAELNTCNYSIAKAAKLALPGARPPRFLHLWVRILLDTSYIIARCNFLETENDSGSSGWSARRLWRK
jgi:hypothetical protein